VSKKIVPEDYYRVLKQNKEIQQNQKSKSKAKLIKDHNNHESISKASKYSPSKTNNNAGESNIMD